MDPQVEPGDVLDQRYVLQEQRGRRGPVVLWLALDRVLDRPVALRVIPGLTRERLTLLTEAATLAGQVPDARWVRILDIGNVPENRRRTAWVVSEWVEAPSLATVLQRGPLPTPTAVAVVRACLQAVVAAHAVGAQHGRLHPAEVLLPADGPPRLTDLATGAVVRDGRGYDDLRGLGGLLVAATTGRWPLPGWSGLPAADPHPAGGLTTGGRRRRDAVMVGRRAVHGEYGSLPELGRSLAALPTAPDHPEPEPLGEPRPRRWRRWAWWVAPPVLVAAVGVAAYSAGSGLGRVPGAARSAAPGFTQPGRHSPGVRHGHLVWSRPPRVSSFDPAGDGAEDPGGVGLAVDDDPTTAWTTDTYRSARLGGLKPGVGLLLDLRRPTTVGTVQLLLSAAGGSLQIRAGDAAPSQAGDLPVVGSRSSAPTATRIALPRPVTARYWLVWLTSLPPGGGGYRLGVGEVALLR